MGSNPGKENQQQQQQQQHIDGFECGGFPPTTNTNNSPFQSTVLKWA
jgi:hypothetical protein